MRRLLTALAAAGLLAVPRVAGAHVGSPDVFVDTMAGPYRVYVTVRPPYAIPGIAEVEVVVPGGGIDRLRVAPLPLTGPGARFAPAPDVATRSASQPNVFTATLWMMSAGAWQVRIEADGASGPGAAAVPVPTLPNATLQMSRALGALLVAIVAAIARDATLPPGEAPDARARRRGRLTATVAACLVAAVVVAGNWWWRAEAANYSRYVYKPLTADTSVSEGVLRIALRDPGWIPLRRLDDLVPDHGHVMHLFLVSPALDRLWHLHPSESEPGRFEAPLPALGAGERHLFADLVHASGISETVTGTIEAPAGVAHDLEGDDSAWQLAGPVGSDAAPLPGGGRMVWMHGSEPLRPRQLTLFAFRVEDPDGSPATDLELYMGMPGHAIFIRRDRSVFAHVHPSGSAPMAAMEIGQRQLAAAGVAAAASGDHLHHQAALPPTITFPYGFPAAGDYRIFVQVKRQGRIETGAFDVHVE